MPSKSIPSSFGLNPFERSTGLLVILLSLGVFGIHLASTPVTGAIADPVAQLRAQDEALYANAGQDFARRGGWLTPRFLGRYLLYKPPLAAWLAGLSLKGLGDSLWAMRAPFVLAAALLCWLIWRAGGWAAAALLWASPLLHIYARMAYTDVLVALAFAGTLLVEIPWLAGLFAATGILAKSAAGVLPLLALAALKPGWKKWLTTVAWAVAFAAPWHIYQLLVHREWFWTEYIERQLLAFGTSRIAMQATEDPHWLFYGKRLLLTDPLLLALALLGLALARPKTPLAWLVTLGAALFLFRYRNFQYLVPLVPGLALAAAAWRPKIVLTLALLSLPVKTAFPDQPWGVRWGMHPIPDAAPNLREYADLRRARPLVLVETDDEFHAATLGLPRIHYYFVDPQDFVADYAPHYLPLGITLRGDEFRDLGQHFARYTEALRRWGLPSSEPIGTAVVDRTDRLLETVRQRPDCDYYLPERFGGQAPATHEEKRARGRVFWLARSPR